MRLVSGGHAYATSEIGGNPARRALAPQGFGVPQPIPK
jgi:hypothetical protein